MPAALLLLRGHVFRNGSKSTDPWVQVSTNCHDSTIQREQHQAFLSHLAFAAELRKTHSVTVVLHTYEQVGGCAQVLRTMLGGINQSSGATLNARIVQHDLNQVRGQGSLWRAAFNTPIWASRDSALSMEKNFDVAIVLRADVRLRHGGELAHDLLSSWNDRRHLHARNVTAIFASPFGGNRESLLQLENLRPGQELEPYQRKFHCTSHARLFSPTPWVVDQIHLVPRGLFHLARAFFFGHEATECLRERGFDFRFLTSRCRFHRLAYKRSVSLRLQHNLNECPSACTL